MLEVEIVKLSEMLQNNILFYRNMHKNKFSFSFYYTVSYYMR